MIHVSKLDFTFDAAGDLFTWRGRSTHALKESGHCLDSWARQETRTGIKQVNTVKEDTAPREASTLQPFDPLPKILLAFPSTVPSLGSRRNLQCYFRRRVLIGFEPIASCLFQRSWPWRLHSNVPVISDVEAEPFNTTAKAGVLIHNEPNQVVANAFGGGLQGLLPIPTPGREEQEPGHDAAAPIHPTQRERRSRFPGVPGAPTHHDRKTGARPWLPAKRPGTSPPLLARPGAYPYSCSSSTPA